MSNRTLIIFSLCVAMLSLGFSFGYETGKYDYECHQIGGGSAIGPDGKMGAFKICKTK